MNSLRFRQLGRICLLVALLLAVETQSLHAQRLVNSLVSDTVVPKNSVTDSFAGSWTYRSFLSNPDLAVQPNALLFGSGTLAITVTAPDRLIGTLGGQDWQLSLRGGVTHGNPASIQFQGKGMIDGEEWIYDYLGYMVPVWPNGENQRPAIVGTIVRTKLHSNGSGGVSPAGVVAQWIAVQQDNVLKGAAGRTKASATGSPALSAVVPASAQQTHLIGLIRHNPAGIHAPFGGLYSHGVEVPAGYRTLYIAGQAGVSLNGGVPADPDAQLDNAWNNLKQVLDASGMTVDDLVNVNCYLADDKYATAYARSIARHLGKERPAMAAPIVRRLWSPDWYVEIEAVAAKVEEPRRTAAVLQTAPQPGSEASLGTTESLDASTVDRSPDAVRPGNEQLRELYQRQHELEKARESVRRQRQLQNLRKLSPAVPPTATASTAVGAPSSLNPFTVTSANGRLDLTLDLDYHAFKIGNDQVRLRSYQVGGDKLGPQYPIGPVIRCKVGDTLYITLNNRLPLNPAGDSHGPNGHHQWNNTNLHFHGLHVAPQGPQDRPYGRSGAESDNVLIEIPPSKPFQPFISTQYYAVKIPSDHPAGTFWYHAHKHGAVAAQVSSGLLGALIVERDPKDARLNLDSIPEVAAASQEVMVLQQIPYASNVFGSVGGIEPTSPTAINDMFGPTKWGKMGRYTLVNGLRIPTIFVAPGEVRRLRLVHAGQREEMVLKIERGGNTNATKVPPSIYEIALDGLVSGLLQNKDAELSVFPGYRSDVLLQAPLDGEGEYFLVDDMLPADLKGADGSPEPVRHVARIVVTGAPRKMDLPSTTELAKRRLPDMTPVAGTAAQFAFYGIDQFTLGSGKIAFLVSQRDLSSSTAAVIPNVNAYFYSEGPTRVLERDRIDKWIIGSRNGPATSTDPTPLAVTHPFHIHINPFLITRVTDPQGGDVTNLEFGGPVWRDTLAMRQGYTYELVTKYDTFTGSFVDHCHILDHEDQGMMELVTIREPVAPLSQRLSTPLNHVATAPVQEKGKPSVLLFVRDSLCPHCMAQLVEMTGKLSLEQANVSVISASTVDDLKNFPSVPFTLVADPESRHFRRYGVFEGEARHGTLAFDAAGNEVLRVVGDEPLIDAAVVLKALKQAPAGSHASAQ